jgi:hypothetical protein
MKPVELREGEKILSKVKGDCWQIPYSIYSQTYGKYIFTNQRIIFIGGGIFDSLRLTFEIEISDIQRIKKCLVGGIMPTGIRIYIRSERDTYILSVLKRKKYMNMLTDLMK